MHSDPNFISAETGLPIQISEAAVSEVKRLIAQEDKPDLFLRIGVSSGGCSGMSYQMSFDNSPSENDRILNFDGLELRVDEQALTYLNGTHIDYSNGLMGGGFKFSNPNASKSCGCGSSFSC